MQFKDLPKKLQKELRDYYDLGRDKVFLEFEDYDDEELEITLSNEDGGSIGTVCCNQNQMPGCCGIIVYSELEFDDDIMSEVWLKYIYSKNKTCMYTTIPTQTHIVALLKNSKFKPVSVVRSNSTLNMITVWVYNKRMK